MQTNRIETEMKSSFSFFNKDGLKTMVYRPTIDKGLRRGDGY